jgi:hypothetical protein
MDCFRDFSVTLNEDIRSDAHSTFPSPFISL